MTTGKQVSATMGGFTPSFDCVLQDVGLVGAAVFGRIWRYCQGYRGACDASIETIAGELNTSTRTVLRWAKKLCALGYLEDMTPDLRNKPHTYRDTGKVSLQVHIVATTESHTATPEAVPGMTESHSAMTLSYSHYDRESLEESTKRPCKREEKESPSGDVPPTSATPPEADAETDDNLWPSSPRDGEKEPSQERGEEQPQSILDFRDPMAMAAECEKRRPNGVPDWAMNGDGPDPYWDVLKAFCTITHRPLDQVQGKTGKAWLGQFAKIGGGWVISPDLMARATLRLPGVQGVKWLLDNNKWTSPYAESYIEQLDFLACQMRAGIEEQEIPSAEPTIYAMDTSPEWLT